MTGIEDASVSWRIRSLEHRVNRLESNKPDVIAERVENLSREVAELRADGRSLKRALYAFALSIAGSAVAFAFVVLQLISR